VLQQVGFFSFAHKIRTATSVREHSRSCSHSVMFRPLDLLATPIAPTAACLNPAHTAAVAFTSEQNTVSYQTTRASDMLVVRNGKIDDKGLSPLNFETCRLLQDLECAQSFDPRFSRPPCYPVQPDFPGTVSSHGFLHCAAFPTPSRLKCSSASTPGVAGLPDRFRHDLSFWDLHVPMRACRHVPRVPSHFWGVTPQVVAFTTTT
jgi:hypothetical protein